VKKTLWICINTAGFLFFSLLSFSQTDSCHLRISLLTCSPGEELYSSWGHTAIRVTDRNTGTDMVYNYGTFDDSDPNFYLRFTRGIMNYALSAYPFSDFLREYEFQGRGIIEQVLRLSCAEKTSIFNALQTNNTESNRFYNYYFHTDNCTTRAEDIIVQNISAPVVFRPVLSKSLTFRQLINPYLDKNGQSWGKFGTDLFLGMNLDKKMTNKEARFLPDYLKKGFDSAQINNQPLVSQSATILRWPRQGQDAFTWFTPLLAFTVLLMAVGALTLRKAGWSNKVLLLFDRMFFLLVGLLGFMMLILWVIRIDDVCRNNLNVLWALPTHVIAAFFIGSPRPWVRKYFQIVFWLSIVLAFTWFFIPQQLNNAVGPLILLIIIRSYHHSKKINDSRKNTGN
jgi:hypothetical protein